MLESTPDRESGKKFPKAKKIKKNCYWSALYIAKTPVCTLHKAKLWKSFGHEETKFGRNFNYFTKCESDEAIP